MNETKQAAQLLFINASQNRDGNTAHVGHRLLAGSSYQQLNLVDYKIYQLGQNYDDDQFNEIVDEI